MVIATPVPTHAELATRVLAAGKHCFVEKPLAQLAEEAEAVVEAARPPDRVLMVGHLLEYHPGVERLNELVSSGELGDLHYIYSNRLNLGKHRQDENALWSLGAHDVSVILRLADEEPSSATRSARATCSRAWRTWCSRSCASTRGSRRTCTCPGSTRTRSAASRWSGSKRMATFDDMELERKLTVYDKGFDEDYSSYGEYIARSGDVYSPRISNEEPLRIECAPLHRVHPGRARSRALAPSPGCASCACSSGSSVARGELGRRRR